MKRSCLEIEARAVAELNHRRDELASLTTSIDLLQVHSLRRAEPKVAWNTNLDHESLLRLVGVSPPNITNHTTFVRTDCYSPKIQERRLLFQLCKFCTYMNRDHL